MLLPGRASTHSTTTSAADAFVTRTKRIGMSRVDHRAKPAHTAWVKAGRQPVAFGAGSMNTRNGRVGLRSHRARTGRATLVTSAAAATGDVGNAVAFTATNAAPM